MKNEISDVSIANKNFSEKEVFDDLSNFLNQHISTDGRILWVGFSGGLDSTVLLYLIHQYFEWLRPEQLTLRAMHINHGLQTQADEWELHCDNFCRKLNIPLIVGHVESIQIKGFGLEQAAREARFEIFEKNMLKNDVLCLAHHLRDQAETFLFRSIRGSGLHGLSAMKQVQQRKDFVMLKPLLNIPVEVLEMIAKHHNLKWIEDPSNADNTFDRNFLRNNVLKTIRTRWQDVDYRLAKTADLCREQAILLDDLAKNDASFLQLKGNSISLLALQQLSSSRVRNFLGWWFRSENLQIPSRSRMTNIQKTLSKINIDNRFKQKLGHYQLQQSGEKIFLIPEELSSSFQIKNSIKRLNRDGDILQINFNFHTFTIIIQIKSKGLKNIDERKIKICFNIELKNINLENHRIHKTLKNIYQENDIPSWLRINWPGLYIDKNMYAICGVGNLKQNIQPENISDLATKVIIKWGSSGHFERADKVF